MSLAPRLTIRTEWSNQLPPRRHHHSWPGSGAVSPDSLSSHPSTPNRTASSNTYAYRQRFIREKAISDAQKMYDRNSLPSFFKLVLMYHTSLEQVDAPPTPPLLALRPLRLTQQHHNSTAHIRRVHNTSLRTRAFAH